MNKYKIITSVITIASALISLHLLRAHANLSEPLNWIIAIGIAFLVTLVAVFIMGAAGKFPNSDHSSS